MCFVHNHESFAVYGIPLVQYVHKHAHAQLALLCKSCLAYYHREVIHSADINLTTNTEQQKLPIKYCTSTVPS